MYIIPVLPDVPYSRLPCCTLFCCMLICFICFYLAQPRSISCPFQVLREYKFRYRPLPLFCADPDLPAVLAYVGGVVEREVQLCAQMEYYVRDAQLGLSELRYFVREGGGSLPPQL